MNEYWGSNQRDSGRLLYVRGALPIAHILHFFALFPQFDPIATFPRSVKVSPNGNPIFIDDSLSVREEWVVSDE
jgi:hypothetical protein